MRGLAHGCMAAVAAMLAIAGSGARAADEDVSYPLLRTHLHLTFEHDRVIDGSYGANRVHDTFTDSQADVTYFFTPATSLRGRVHVEEQRQPTSSRTFDDHSAYIEHLFLYHHGGWFTLTAGKFHPYFGIGWDIAPGVFGADFDQDYEKTEAIGVGGSLRYDTGVMGRQKLRGSLYFEDDTFLSQRLGARPRFGLSDTIRPGHLRLSDGGAGNSGEPNSYSLALDGDRIPWLRGIGYHLGFNRLARGVTETRHEDGFATALYYTGKPGKAVGLTGWLADLQVTPLVERVWLNQVGGNSFGKEQNRRYLTTSIEFALYGWSVSALRTGRSVIEPAEGTGPLGASSQDRLLTATLAYNFDRGLGLQFGWKRERISTVNADTVGFLLIYDVDF